jgi:hypothetical protein
MIRQGKAQQKQHVQWQLHPVDAEQPAEAIGLLWVHCLSLADACGVCLVVT